jgi:hypothetical protein
VPERICEECGTTVPEGRSMCPSCGRIVSSGVAVAAMPKDQLPPGMTDEPEAVYGRAGEERYRPPTAHQVVRYERKGQPGWMLVVWVLILVAVLAAAIVGILAVAG